MLNITETISLLIRLLALFGWWRVFFCIQIKPLMKMHLKIMTKNYFFNRRRSAWKIFILKKKPIKHSATNNLKRSFNFELSTPLLRCDYSCLQSIKQSKPYSPWVPEAVGYVGHIYILIHIFTFNKIMMQCFVLSLIKTKEQEIYTRNP